MVKEIKIIGIILIVIAILIPLSYKATDNILIKINDTKIEEKKKENDYYAILEIAKINLKREIFKINDTNNNVNKNLQLHASSIMPGNNLSRVIVLGHSGNGLNAYFKNLYKLKIKDEVKLYYHNYIYTYEIKEIEEQNKTGEVYLKENKEDVIVLITCTKNNKNTQTIYYGYLKNKEKIVKN